jgi:NADH-quinone oxidoreductase subunit N
MSVGAKVGGFAALLRIFVVALPDLVDVWAPAIAVLAALTMIFGNVVALAQTNIKRMLAYSSIAHAGYILMAVAAVQGSDEGVSAALFYMLAYLFSNLGAFGVVIALERSNGEGVNLEDYKGLARRSPALAAAMAFFMLSLTGIPPTAGFAGKFYVFRAVVEADLIWLALVGAVTTVISAYFYLRVVYYSYMYEGEGEVSHYPVLNTAVALTAVATLLVGLLPAPWFELARQATLQGVLALAGG